jgi:hypothetical protein
MSSPEKTRVVRALESLSGGVSVPVLVRKFSNKFWDIYSLLPSERRLPSRIGVFVVNPFVSFHAM